MQTLALRWRQAALHPEMPPNWTQSTTEQLSIARDKVFSFPPEPLQLADTALWKTIQEILATDYLKCVQSIPELVISQAAVIMLGDKSMEW